MGKKSRNPKKVSKQALAPPQAAAPAAPQSTTTADGNVPMDAVTYPPSDGPSNEELDCLQTTSESLQTKLDQLTSAILANDRAHFVQQFVPLDLSPADTARYLEDLTTAPEAEGQWTNLASEIAALAAGQGVTKIEGDQQTRAVFYFEHPLLKGCDREVTFTGTVMANGTTEWRAEG